MEETHQSTVSCSHLDLARTLKRGRSSPTTQRFRAKDAKGSVHPPTSSRRPLRPRYEQTPSKRRNGRKGLEW
jgi:hypothetical protein